MKSYRYHPDVYTRGSFVDSLDGQKHSDDAVIREKEAFNRIFNLLFIFSTLLQIIPVIL